jgi:hypothetical protein
MSPVAPGGHAGLSLYLSKKTWWLSTTLLALTLLLQPGMRLESIQKLLGHTKLETTQINVESSLEMIKTPLFSGECAWTAAGDA